MTEANEAVHLVAAKLAQRTGKAVETAFLECSPPTVRDAAGKLVAGGVAHIVIVPYFLTMGIHLKRDLPAIVDELRPDYPSVTIEIAEPLDGHPALLDILVDRSRNIRQGGSSL